MCKEPVTIPDGLKLDKTAYRLWAKDRLALVDCGDRHALLSRAIEQRDAIQGATQ